MFLKWARALTKRSAHQRDKNVVFTSTAVVLNAQRKPENICIGSNSIIQCELFIFAHGGKISIGRDCFIGANTRIWSGCSIKIGNRVLISHDVNIFDNDTHPFDAEARHRHFLSIRNGGHPSDISLGEQPVHIHDDAWVGAKAIVLKGVVIGEGAVVAAGAVVTKNVEPYTVVAGNPARLVRVLEQIDERS